MIPALLTVVLLTGALAVSLPFIPARQRKWSLSLVLLVFIPSPEGCSLATWIFGALGSLSIPSLALLGAFIVRKLGGPAFFSDLDRQSILLFTLITGLLLYPATLGLTVVDPYAYGWHSPALYIPLSIGLLSTWFLKAYRLCCLYSLATCGSLLGLYESTNILDTLLDPLLFLVAAWTLFQRSQPTPLPA